MPGIKKLKIIVHSEGVINALPNTNGPIYNSIRVSVATIAAIIAEGHTVDVEIGPEEFVRLDERMVLNLMEKYNITDADIEAAIRRSMELNRIYENLNGVKEVADLLIKTIGQPDENMETIEELGEAIKAMQGTGAVRDFNALNTAISAINVSISNVNDRITNEHATMDQAIDTLEIELAALSEGLDNILNGVVMSDFLSVEQKFDSIQNGFTLHTFEDVEVAIEDIHLRNTDDALAIGSDNAVTAVELKAALGEIVSIQNDLVNVHTIIDTVKDDLTNHVHTSLIYGENQTLTSQAIVNAIDELETAKGAIDNINLQITSNTDKLNVLLNITIPGLSQEVQDNYESIETLAEALVIVNSDIETIGNILTTLLNKAHVQNTDTALAMGTEDEVTVTDILIAFDNIETILSSIDDHSSRIAQLELNIEDITTNISDINGRVDTLASNVSGDIEGLDIRLATAESDIIKLNMSDRVLYVDRSTTETESDGSKLRPFKTIQSALDVIPTAKTNDDMMIPYTVKVASGNYPEDIVFNINGKRVIIVTDRHVKLYNDISKESNTFTLEFKGYSPLIMVDDVMVDNYTIKPSITIMSEVGNGFNTLTPNRLLQSGKGFLITGEFICDFDDSSDVLEGVDIHFENCVLIGNRSMDPGWVNSIGDNSDMDFISIVDNNKAGNSIFADVSTKNVYLAGTIDSDHVNLISARNTLSQRGIWCHQLGICREFTSYGTIDFDTLTTSITAGIYDSYVEGKISSTNVERQILPVDGVVDTYINDNNVELVNVTVKVLGSAKLNEYRKLYVDKHFGKIDGDGTKTKPFDTIQKAFDFLNTLEKNNDGMMPPYVVGVTSGEYPEDITLDMLGRRVVLQATDRVALCDMLDVVKPYKDINLNIIDGDVTLNHYRPQFELQGPFDVDTIHVRVDDITDVGISTELEVKLTGARVKSINTELVTDAIDVYIDRSVIHGSTVGGKMNLIKMVDSKINTLLNIKGIGYITESWINGGILFEDILDGSYNDMEPRRCISSSNILGGSIVSSNLTSVTLSVDGATNFNIAKNNVGLINVTLSKVELDDGGTFITNWEPYTIYKKHQPIINGDTNILYRATESYSSSSDISKDIEDGLLESLTSNTTGFEADPITGEVAYDTFFYAKYSSVLNSVDDNTRQDGQNDFTIPKIDLLNGYLEINVDGVEYWDQIHYTVIDETHIRFNEQISPNAEVYGKVYNYKPFVEFLYIANSGVVDSLTDDTRVTPQTDFVIADIDIEVESFDVKVDGLEMINGVNFELVNGNTIRFTEAIDPSSTLYGRIWSRPLLENSLTFDVFNKGSRMSFIYHANSDIMDSESNIDRISSQRLFTIPRVDLSEDIMNIYVDRLECIPGLHYKLVNSNTLEFLWDIPADSIVHGDIFSNNRITEPSPQTPKLFEYEQVRSGTQWTIKHRFGYRPVVNITGVDGYELYPEIWNSANVTIVSFNKSFSGFATLR